MKKLSLLLPLFFCSVFLSAQDARTILTQSFDTCQAVQHGSYEMNRYMKYLSGEDTTASSYRTIFRKLPDDTIFATAFHTFSYYDGKYTGEEIYTGQHLLSAYLKDSSATIMSNALWASDIQDRSHNYEFFSLLTDEDSSPLPNGEDFDDEDLGFALLPDDIVEGMPCYHVHVIDVPKDDEDDFYKTLQVDHHYWINKKDFIPIQFSIAFELKMGNDTMYQYERKTITSYDISQPIDEDQLTIESIPSYYKLKDYTPYKSPEPLPVDTIAPDWELPLLTDEMLKLSDLRGQLVVMDFFYKSCFPCMKALPALQSLHEKYRDQGVVIIGIDPYDKKEDGIGAFLTKQGVTYQVVLEAKDVAKLYRVSGYPTLYIIGKDGKILHNQIGYGDETEAKLENVIVKHL